MTIIDALDEVVDVLKRLVVVVIVLSLMYALVSSITLLSVTTLIGYSFQAHPVLLGLTDFSRELSD